MLYALCKTGCILSGIYTRFNKIKRLQMKQNAVFSLCMRDAHRISTVHMLLSRRGMFANVTHTYQFHMFLTGISNNASTV